MARRRKMTPERRAFIRNVVVMERESPLQCTMKHKKREYEWEN